MNPTACRALAAQRTEDYAFALLTGDNKELVIVPGASHVDLYDGGASGAIPFDRIEAFFRAHLA